MPLRIIANNTKTNVADIAPCGMNCRLCYGTMREKRQCPGCRGGDRNKSASCIACRIKNCDKLTNNSVVFCFSCNDFPCARLKQLDKRYRLKYGMSMMENLSYIQQNGIRKFVKNETARWACTTCGTTLCVHRPDCPKCGNVWR